MSPYNRGRSMTEETKIPDVIVRPQADGTTLIDVPIPKPDVRQEVTLIVNRGKGEEVHTEQD